MILELSETRGSSSGSAHLGIKLHRTTGCVGVIHADDDADDTCTDAEDDDNGDDEEGVRCPIIDVLAQRFCNSTSPSSSSSSTCTYT